MLVIVQSRALIDLSSLEVSLLVQSGPVDNLDLEGEISECNRVPVMQSVDDPRAQAHRIIECAIRAAQIEQVKAVAAWAQHRMAARDAAVNRPKVLEININCRPTFAAPQDSIAADI